MCEAGAGYKQNRLLPAFSPPPSCFVFSDRTHLRPLVCKGVSFSALQLLLFMPCLTSARVLSAILMPM